MWTCPLRNRVSDDFRMSIFTLIGVAWRWGCGHGLRKGIRVLFLHMPIAGSRVCVAYYLSPGPGTEKGDQDCIISQDSLCKHGKAAFGITSICYGAWIFAGWE